MVEYHEQRARAVLDLASHVEAQIGASAGAKLFRNELLSPYGHPRRQMAVRTRVPSVAGTVGGEWFLGITRARDVDMWLEAAATYLELKIPAAPTAKSAAKPSAQAPAPAAPKSSGGLDLSGFQNWGRAGR